MERVRQIIYFKDYFFNFFDGQTKKVKEKIDYVLFVVTVAERIPPKFFQHLEGTGGLYEIRVDYQGNIYRLFCCFDGGTSGSVIQWISKEKSKDAYRRTFKSIEN
ncbi:MAG: type II toxin-antitoxin system RelE/ParE family toxin [Bacteroidia bacterium]